MPAYLTNAERHHNIAVSSGWIPFFQAAADRHNVRLDVLMGIASHETHMGTAKTLTADWTGDFGHGRGLMQIDDRWHKSFIASHRNDDHAANIMYAAKLLRAELRAFDEDYVKALAAYNAGGGNVRIAIRAGLDPQSPTTPYKQSKGAYGYSDEVLEWTGFHAGFLGSNFQLTDSTLAQNTAGNRYALAEGHSGPTVPAEWVHLMGDGDVIRMVPDQNQHILLALNVRYNLIRRSTS